MKALNQLSWTSTNLDEVGEIFCGQSVSEPDVNLSGIGVVYVTGPEQWNGEHIEENKWTTSPRRMVPEGCIFITVKGAGVGKTFPGIAGAIGRDIYAYKPSQAVDTEFVHTAIRHRIASLVAEARGDIPGLSRDHLAEYALALPRLAEQRRIVAKLDVLTARLTRARAELERVSSLGKQLRNASLSAARKAALSYPAQTVAQLVETSFDGPFGSHLRSADYTDDGVQVVRLENVGHLSFASEKKTFISVEKFATLTRHSLLPGDIIFSSFVDREVRICRLPQNVPSQIINKADCFTLRVNETKCDPGYLTYFLAAPETYEDMRYLVHGATRPRIGLSDLRNYKIHVPDPEHQQLMVAQIEAAFARADRLEAEAARARALLDRLEAAILAKAFRGELVPQDPTDEPASALLDRIRAERAAAPKPKRGRRPKAPA